MNDSVSTQPTGSTLPFDRAIDELQRSLDTMRNNEPFWRAEGNHEQADLNKANGDDYEAAIGALRKAQAEFVASAPP